VWRDLRRDDDEAPIESKTLILRLLRLRAEGDSIPAAPTQSVAPQSPAPAGEAETKPEASKPETRERVDSNAIPADMFGPVAGTASPVKEESTNATSSGEGTAAATPVMEAAPAQSSEEKKMDEIKAKGNDHFKKGEFPPAMEAYGKAVEIWEGMAEKSAAANKCLCACLNNRAACKIQVRDFDDAIVDCTRLLEIEPKNAKALLRRGTSYEHIEKYGKALKDVEAVLSIDASSKQAKDVKNRVTKNMKSLGLL